MKYLLALMCGLMMLFLGGCAVLALPTGPLAAIPGGLAFLNLAIIGALFRWKVQWRPAFYILGVIDFVVAILSGLIAESLGPYDRLFFWAIAVGFAVKGILSFVYASRLKGHTP